MLGCLALDQVDHLIAVGLAGLGVVAESRHVNEGSTICVQPQADDVAVVRQQFFELPAVHGPIGSCPDRLLAVLSDYVAGEMPIVPGDIQAQADAVFLASIGHFAHHVALAVLPGRTADAVVGRLGRPEAEPIVMFRGEDEVLGVERLGHAHPLLGVKLGRIKDLRIGSRLSNPRP